MSSSNLPEAGARLILEKDDWEANWASAEDTATSAITGIQSEIDSVSSDIDIGFNIEDAALPFDDIPESTETDVQTTQSEDSKKVVEGITFLATMKKIETIINVAGTALNFIKDIGSLVVNPFLDVEDSVAKINAQTGGTGIADLGQFIRDIQAADLGESVDDISNVVIAAKQLGAPIDEATRASLTFTHTFQDQNPVTVMGTLKAVTDEFGVSMTTASDLMTVFFQQGGNKGGDALSTVDKYATAWHDMGLEIPQALSAVTSLMAGGVDTSDAASKMLLDFDNAMTTASADPSSQQAQMLKLMKIDNPKDAGQAIGAETIDGFASAFAKLPADQQDLVSGLFFGKTGKLDTGAIAGMTTQSDMFKNVTDAAELAATEIDNSLRGAIDDFVTAINGKVAELLSSEAIDLPGKIAALKEGLQQGLDVLANGGTIGDALEVALNIPGLSKALDTFIGNFERIIGNMEILFLQLVATIQDITGNGKAAEGTRAQIKGLAQKQLAFDLQLGTADEIGAQITQAFSRGLSVPEIGDAVDIAINESIANANFDKSATIIQGMISAAIANGASPEAAQQMADEYVTKLNNGFDNALSAGNLNLAQKFLAIDPNAKVPGLDDAVASMQKQLSDAFIPKGGGDAGNPFTSGMFAGQGKDVATSNSLLGGLVTQVDDFKAKVTDADTVLAASFDHIATTTDTMNTAVGTSLTGVQTNMQTTSTAAQQMDTDIATAMLTNTVTASFEAVALAAQTSFPAVVEWFNRTSQASAVLDAQVSGHIGHLLGLLHDLQFLSAQVATGVQAALTLGAGLAGGGGTTNNNNVTVNNNVNSTAAAAANGYAVAASLRNG